VIYLLLHIMPRWKALWMRCLPQESLLKDEEFITYVLAGLDQDYNSVVESITGKEELSLGSVYS
jgi:hypothetical protein